MTQPMINAAIAATAHIPLSVRLRRKKKAIAAMPTDEPTHEPTIVTNG